MTPLISSRLRLSAVFLLIAGSLSAAQKPNIILIYSDDHGYADLAAQGSIKDIQTPNLDAMAREGVRFNRGYVSAPQCVPSRAGVMTGRYQQRFGVEDNAKGPMPLEELTIAERLKPAGYISCQVGKWHLEPGGKSEGGKSAGKRAPIDHRQFLPLGQGFDEYYTGAMNSFVASHDLKGDKLPDAPKTLTDDRFRVLWQTDAALSFIDRHAADPFFLYLAYYTPHVPLASPEPWFSRTPADAPLERRQAMAMIAAMDEGVGRLRRKLRDKGIEKNTLVLFIGDNGAPLTRGAWNGSLNLPLTGEKGMLTDGGIRTPFLAAWPGTLQAGKVYEPPVINLDVAATAVALAGLPHDPKLDGVNLMPYLRGEKTGNPHEDLFWRWRSQAAVRSGHWKLILLGKDEKFLFDLDSPEGETKNRLAENPRIAAELEGKLMAWNATLPPPGLPRPIVDQDQMFYDNHVLKGAAPTPARSEKSKAKGKGKAKAAAKTAPKSAAVIGAGEIQGWVGRNCTLILRDGALRLQPETTGGKKAAKPFIVRTDLELPGPVTATLNVLCPKGGAGSISWRAGGQQDFAAGQTFAFTLAASAAPQQVKIALPVTGKLIHLRLYLPQDPALAISSIELQSTGSAKPTTWNFRQ